MLYHILESLRYLNSGERIPAGTMSPLEGLSPETIALLVAKGRISAIVLPPLRVLPDFGERAEEYAERGIESFQDLVDSAPSLLSEEGLDVEEDIEDAVKWADPEYDSPGATPVLGLLADVFEVVADDEPGE